MVQQQTKLHDVDRDRKELIEELKAEHGTNWSKDFEPGSLGCHELLDRTNLLAEMVGDRILTHPSCLRNPAWFELAHTAHEALQELYQQVGEKH